LAQRENQMTKVRLPFVVRDVDDRMIGEGIYYPAGGNIMLNWFEEICGTGNMQISLETLLRMKNVYRFEWKNRSDVAKGM